MPRRLRLFVLGTAPLGTGKTATAVSTAEGLSKDMKTYTLLPASLESEFMNEVKTWGDSLFKIKSNHWVFLSILDNLQGQSSFGHGW